LELSRLKSKILKIKIVRTILQIRPLKTVMMMKKMMKMMMALERMRETPIGKELAEDKKAKALLELGG
jgi:hypothetical protein